MPKKILIIEDEAAIADNIIYALKSDGFDPLWSATGLEGKQILDEQSISLIILDVGLPDINGFELCKQIRKTSTVPIIFLTARSDEIDRIVGLEIGGDDYVVKPFSPREIVARVKAILRRSRIEKVETEEPDDSPFQIYDSSKSIKYFGKKLNLSAHEYKLLITFINHPNRVFSRDELLQMAWDEPDFCLERTVDAHIKSIRSKLKSIKPEFDAIETRRGFGYTLRSIS